MTDALINPGALGDEYDREVPKVTLERRAVEAITDVIRKHDAEFVAALENLGLDWHSVAMPYWQRFMTTDDVARLTTMQTIAQANAELQAFRDALIDGRVDQKDIGGNGL